MTDSALEAWYEFRTSPAWAAGSSGDESDFRAGWDAATARNAEAIAFAWDEGFDAGERDVMQHSTFDEPCIPNPYRSKVESEHD